MKRLFIPTLAALAVAACSGPEGWTVEGTVEDGEGRKMAVEGFNAGRWYVIDSVQIERGGSFAYHAPAPAAVAEVLRLNFDGRTIYFPVDSIDRLSIATDTAGFGTDYTLTGTPAAEKIVAIDRMIAAGVAAKGADGALADPELKQKLNEIAINDSTCIAAYYIINKNIGGRPLYDLSQRRDLGIVGAVAQRFADMRPDDARTKWLTQIYLAARRASNPAAATSGVTLEAQESGLIDITRFDNRGASQSLAEVAGKGGVTVLSFTNYDLENSPAYNVILADLHRRYAAQGLQIYQIAFDADEVEWKRKADNLPWITVWNSPVDGADVLMQYNVGTLPLTYVIDRNGTIAERVVDPAKLSAAVAKHI
ncbi:MAG: redoxin domain-containing protein [Muribaculaceae bacterium]|nr:redoxin domain-containing protein [Muribaculaceae bacterium]